jgi:hypothetical protein
VFERANLVIISDHGMTATSRERRTYLDDVLPLADVEVVNYGILAWQPELRFPAGTGA